MCWRADAPTHFQCYPISTIRRNVTFYTKNYRVYQWWITSFMVIYIVLAEAWASVETQGSHHFRTNTNVYSWKRYFCCVWVFVESSLVLVGNENALSLRLRQTIWCCRNLYIRLINAYYTRYSKQVCPKRGLNAFLAAPLFDHFLRISKKIT